MSPSPAARPPKARVRTVWPHSASFWGRERQAVRHLAGEHPGLALRR